MGHTPRPDIHKEPHRPYTTPAPGAAYEAQAPVVATMTTMTIAILILCILNLLFTANVLQMVQGKK